MDLSKSMVTEVESPLWKRFLYRGLPTGDFCHHHHQDQHPHHHHHHHGHHPSTINITINRCGVSDDELERKKKIYLDHLKEDPALGFSVIDVLDENTLRLET